MTKSELDRYLLENHLRTCDKCRQEMTELTAQAKRAEMPEMESEE
jgi:predicted anti-sigma-YlaC factor YlaD